jgi:hypothetical protein
MHALGKVPHIYFLLLRFSISSSRVVAMPKAVDKYVKCAEFFRFPEWFTVQFAAFYHQLAAVLDTATGGGPI